MESSKTSLNKSAPPATGTYKGENVPNAVHLSRFEAFDAPLRVDSREPKARNITPCLERRIPSVVDHTRYTRLSTARRLLWRKRISLSSPRPRPAGRGEAPEF